MSLGYLQIHQNPNADRRADGRRYWGYPSRRGPIQLIGLHTAEIAIDEVGPDAGAEKIRDYFTTSTRPASYHFICDSDSEVELLPPEATAFGIVGYNGVTYHISAGCRTIDWDNDPEWTEATIDRLARQAAKIAVANDIPLRYITKQQADEGVKGIVDHATMDPRRRTDPGSLFPRVRFLALAQAYAGGASTTDKDEDEDMATIYDVHGDMYLVGGIHAAHIQHGPTLAALTAAGHKTVKWSGTADDFVDAFILGDEDKGALPRKATPRKAANRKAAK